MKQGKLNLCSHPIGGLYKWWYTIECQECGRVISVPRKLSSEITMAQKRMWTGQEDQALLEQVREIFKEVRT